MNKTGEKISAWAAERLRELPQVDELLARPGLADLMREHGRAMVLRAARGALAQARAEILSVAALSGVVAGAQSADSGDWAARVRERVEAAVAPSLRRV